MKNISIKKCLAEFIGTAVLVIMGCGTAMLVGCNSGSAGYLTTAFAFGLAIVAMAYCVGNISGCHINPAVSLAMFINGSITLVDFISYVVSQCLGGVFGAVILKMIFDVSKIQDVTGAYGSNGLSGVRGSVLAALIVEIILTFIFVMTILGVTSKKHNHGSFGGIIIGLTLTFVHIFGIGLTGTSVNPARSIGPAIIAAISGNTTPLKCVWIFIIAPLVGAVLAAVVYNILEKEDKTPVAEIEESADETQATSDEATVTENEE